MRGWMRADLGEVASRVAGMQRLLDVLAPRRGTHDQGLARGAAAPNDPPMTPQ